MSPAVITANDRLAMTLFIAAALHVLLIFGIAIDRFQERAANSSTRITVALRHDENNPDADFKAQHSQLGSGSEEEVLELSSPIPAVVAELGDAADLRVGGTPQSELRIQAWQNRSSFLIRAINNSHSTTQQANAETGAGSLASQISLIEARLNELRQSSARRPRVRTLTSVSTQAAEDAAYLEQWRQRVEQVGNASYPQEAVDQNLFGNVRLKVSVRANGSVAAIELLKSSGYRLLDRAAIKTVEDASPFAAFPESIRQSTDQLDIIRTWRFEPSGRVHTQ
ncbi:MAG: energy transducer TonB [Gammaproteobacteria bacterium]|nr:energy transducer TonB [Gammaproteobacteria bacterium]